MGAVREGDVEAALLAEPAERRQRPASARPCRARLRRPWRGRRRGRAIPCRRSSSSVCAYSRAVTWTSCPSSSEQPDQRPEEEHVPASSVISIEDPHRDRDSIRCAYGYAPARGLLRRRRRAPQLLRGGRTARRHRAAVSLQVRALESARDAQLASTVGAPCRADRGRPAPLPRRAAAAPPSRSRSSTGCGRGRG